MNLALQVSHANGFLLQDIFTPEPSDFFADDDFLCLCFCRFCRFFFTAIFITSSGWCLRTCFGTWSACLETKSQWSQRCNDPSATSPPPCCFCSCLLNTALLKQVKPHSTHLIGSVVACECEWTFSCRLVQQPNPHSSHW